jgi:DNA-binding HxlR family transcriptional regulator
LARNHRARADRRLSRSSSRNWSGGTKNQQLRDLEHHGVIIRTVYPEVPPKVEYSLTPLGKELCPVLEGLLVWAEKRQQAIETQKKDVKAKKTT